MIYAAFEFRRQDDILLLGRVVARGDCDGRLGVAEVEGDMRQEGRDVAERAGLDERTVLEFMAVIERYESADAINGGFVVAVIMRLRLAARAERGDVHGYVLRARCGATDAEELRHALTGCLSIFRLDDDDGGLVFHGCYSSAMDSRLWGIGR